MYGHFATASSGFIRENGWAIWLGRITSGFHVHLRKRSTPFRSYVEGRLSVWRFSINLTVMVYRPGAMLDWHRDAPDGTPHRALIWTIKKAKRGGMFEWRGPPPRRVIPRVILLDGVQTEHRVTTIEAGNRWVAMVQAAFQRKPCLKNISSASPTQYEQN